MEIRQVEGLEVRVVEVMECLVTCRKGCEVVKAATARECTAKTVKMEGMEGMGEPVIL